MDEKIKRTTLINSCKEGGLKMTHLESYFYAQKVMCIKRYLDSYQSNMEIVSRLFLKKVGENFLFQCNFDVVAKVPVTLPSYYYECQRLWSSLTLRSENNKEMVNEFIWNNKLILVEEKSVFNKTSLKKACTE